MMRALEDGVVVELGVRGEAERAPVLHEGVHHGLRRDPRARLRGDHPPVKGGQVDHFDVRAPTNIKPLDNVDDALELRVVARDRRQVPSPRRRGSPHPTAGLEHTALLENPADRAHRRDPDHVPGQQFGPDDGSAKLPEVAGVPQLLSYLQNQILKGS